MAPRSSRAVACADRQVRRDRWGGRRTRAAAERAARPWGRRTTRELRARPRSSDPGRYARPFRWARTDPRRHRRFQIDRERVIRPAGVRNETSPGIDALDGLTTGHGSRWQSFWQRSFACFLACSSRVLSPFREKWAWIESWWSARRRAVWKRCERWPRNCRLIFRQPFASSFTPHRIRLA